MISECLLFFHLIDSCSQMGRRSSTAHAHTSAWVSRVSCRTTSKARFAPDERYSGAFPLILQHFPFIFFNKLTYFFAGNYNRDGLLKLCATRKAFIIVLSL